MDREYICLQSWSCRSRRRTRSRGSDRGSRSRTTPPPLRDHSHRLPHLPLRARRRPSAPSSGGTAPSPPSRAPLAARDAPRGTSCVASCGSPGTSSLQGRPTRPRSPPSPTRPTCPSGRRAGPRPYGASTSRSRQGRGAACAALPCPRSPRRPRAPRGPHRRAGTRALSATGRGSARPDARGRPALSRRRARR